METHAKTISGSIVLALGAVLLAVVGSGVLGDTAPGAPDFVLQNALGLAAVVLLALGLVGVRRVLRDLAGGRLLIWGLVLVWIGLAALAGGHALAIGAEGVQGDAVQTAAVAAIPLTVGAHLIYPGTSLVGIALLRRRRSPIGLGVLLTISLPLLLLGVPLGLAVGPGVLSDVVTWVATEGQLGAAWCAFAIVASLAARDVRRPVNA